MSLYNYFPNISSDYETPNVGLSYKRIGSDSIATKDCVCIETYGQCNYCEGITDVPKFEECFSLLYTGHSFKLSESTCTCGGFKTFFQAIRPKIKHITRSIVNELETTDHDAFNDLDINEKQYRRVEYRRKKRSKRTKKNHRLKPESGFAADDFFDGCEENFLRYVTSAMLVYKDMSLHSMFLFILQIIEAQTSVKTFSYIRAWFEDIDIDLNTFTVENLSEAFNKAMSNWGGFQKHPLYSLITKLWDLLIVLIFTPSEFINEVMKRYTEMSKDYEDLRKSSSSFIGGALSNIAALMSSLKVYSDTKDVVQAFSIKSPQQKVYDCLDNISAKYISVMQGDIEIPVSVFNEMCEQAIKVIEDIMPLLKFGEERTALWANSRIKSMNTDIISRNVGDDLRIQPYSFVAVGGSGVGKSNIVAPLVEVLLAYNKFPVNIATLNLTDQFLSSLTSATTGAIIDDPNFRPAGVTGINNGMDYEEFVFRCNGNPRWKINKAEIELKGRVDCNILVEGTSTNDWTLGLQDTVKEVGAAFRRHQVYMEVKLKPRFTKINSDGSPSTMMDRDLVIAEFPLDKFPDIYTITLYRCELQPLGAVRFKDTFDFQKHKHQCDLYRFEVIQVDGVVMKNLSIEQTVWFLMSDSTLWFAQQRQLLAKRRTPMEYCEHCHIPKELCICNGGINIRTNSGGEPLHIPPPKGDDDDGDSSVSGSDDNDDDGSTIEDDFDGYDSDDNVSEYETQSVRLARLARNVAVYRQNAILEEKYKKRNPFESYEVQCVVYGQLKADALRLGLSFKDLKELDKARMKVAGRKINKNVRASGLASRIKILSRARNTAATRIQTMMREYAAKDYTARTENMYRNRTLHIRPRRIRVTATTLRVAQQLPEEELLNNSLIYEPSTTMSERLQEAIGVPIPDESLDGSLSMGFSNNLADAQSTPLPTETLDDSLSMSFSELTIETLREAVSTPLVADLAPEAGFDFTAYLMHRDFTEVLHKNFKNVLTNYLTTGKTQFMSTFDIIDSAVSTEVLDLLENVFSSILKHCFQKNLFDIKDWLPAEYEGTPLGVYYHARFGSAPYHSRALTYLKMVSVGAFSLPLIFPTLGFSVLGKFSYLCAGLSCLGYVKYDPPTVESTIEKFYDTYKSSVSLIPTKWSIIGGITTLLLGYFSYKPLLCFSLFKYLYYLNNNKGKYVYDIANMITQSRTSRDSDWRGDVVKMVVSSMVLKKAWEAFGILINIVWYNVGIRPQGGVESAEALSQMAAGDRFWYKRGWENVNLDPIPSDKRCQQKDICSAVNQNVVFVRNETAGTICGGFFICSKLMLLPKHFISSVRSTYKIIRKPSQNGACGNATLKLQFKAKDARQVGADLMLVDVTSSGDFRDMEGYFPTKLDRMPAIGVFLRRNREGNLMVFGVADIRGPTTLTNNFSDKGVLAMFNGMTYTTEGLGAGTCMAVIVSGENPSCILGFHLGAWADTMSGVGCVLLKEDIQRFKMAFSDSLSFSQSANTGDFPQQMYNRNVIIQGLHPNAVMAQFDEPGEFKLFGCTGLIDKDSHDIIDTPINDQVHKIMGCEKHWGPPLLDHPTLGRKEKWFFTLRRYTKPKPSIDRDLLDMALLDYVEPLLETAKECVFKRVLTDHEVINGVKDRQFIDGMAMNTSVGFPLSGTKSRYFDLTTDPSSGESYYVCNTDIFAKMEDKYKTSYLQGKRCYPVFKTFPKIEATDKAKEKVRLVNAAPIAYQMICRRYLLPIYAFLSEDMLLSECAVGVNPESPQWNFLYKYLVKFGVNRIIALDYKDYDTTMAAQVTFASGKVLQMIASIWGWTEEEQKILVGLITDVAWPVISMNGDILMLHGATVSGHNGTVYFNSINNSLLMRVVFYTLYDGGYVKGWIRSGYRRFRDVTHTLTYGDDLVVGSALVSYNGIAISTELGFVGYVLTDAHKTGKIEKFEHISTVEFLKRTFRYDKEFGMYVAVLNESSIFKRLCTIHKPVSPNNISLTLATNMDSALHEWFYHGRVKYEMRRAQLSEIADTIEDGVTKALCRTALAKDFDSRMDLWRRKYVEVV